MRNRKITSKQYFKTAKILHRALVGGVVLFAFIASYMLSGEEHIAIYNTETNIFYIIVGVLGLWALFGGEVIFKNQIKKARIQPALSLKMMQYQSANILKYAHVEGVAVFSIVAAILTLTVWFLIIAGFLVFVLVSYHPSVEKAIKELDLNIEEQKQVNNPDVYISELYDNDE
jgi:cell division protein FtsL